MPRSFVGIGLFEHIVFSLRELIPHALRLQVDLAEFPLAKRVAAALFETDGLFHLADAEIELDKNGALIDKGLFERHDVLHEQRMLFFCTEAEDRFDHGAVIPAAVKEDDFSAVGKMLDIALEVPLRTFLFGRTPEGNDAVVFRVHIAAYTADDTPFSCRITAFKNDDELLRSLQEKEVDAVGIVITDFSRLRRKVHFAPILLTYNGGKFTEQYVLLAHQDGTIKSVSDLRGRSLYVHANPRSNLAPLWLDTLLAQRGHPKASSFAGQISQNTKLSNVVYPVFFRKADACVVTRSGFNTMVELNPQLGRKLTVIAESPHIVPSLFTFRADYNPPFKEQLISGIIDLKNSLAGQQVLTIFQSQDIKIHPIGALNTALKMIETHEQLIRRKK